MKDYSFARNRKIVDVFTESELFDTSYSWSPGIIEIDRPLFLHLEDGSVLRLFGDHLSPAFEESYEIQKGDLGDYHHNATPAFQCLIGKTILAVREIYEPICEAEDLELSQERVALDVILDGAMLMECVSGCMHEFTEIRILERIDDGNEAFPEIAEAASDAGDSSAAV